MFSSDQENLDATPATDTTGKKNYRPHAPEGVCQGLALIISSVDSEIFRKQLGFQGGVSMRLMTTGSLAV